MNRHFGESFRRAIGSAKVKQALRISLSLAVLIFELSRLYAWLFTGNY